MRLSNVAWSAAGLAVPLVVAILCVPPLLHRLGAERFGLLSLAWALTAMSGLFDLGLGRAATRLIADQLGRGELHAPRGTMSAAVRLAAIAGTGGGLLLALAAAAGVAGLLRTDTVTAAEVGWALALLAPAVPLQTLTATYRGVGEACQRFRAVSLVRMALGIANFAAPLAVAQFTPLLPPLVVALVGSRLLACWLFWRLAHEALPAGPGRALASTERRQLLHSGGWVTVSAVVSPLLVQSDRFFIGALVSAAAVASYTVPFEVITQLLVGVTAVATVALPSITQQLRQDHGLARQTFRRWLLRVVVGMAALAGGVALWLPWALPLWLGNALPAESIVIGRWLCLGVWINAIGAMHFAWLHAQGRFRETALLHLLELPLYVVLLLLLLRDFGVVGAAIAWTARVTLDTAALIWLARTHRRAGPG
jgi:O-antigen/teichoic acid export membrane protein